MVTAHPPASRWSAERRGQERLEGGIDLGQDDEWAVRRARAITPAGIAQIGDARHRSTDRLDPIGRALPAIAGGSGTLNEAVRERPHPGLHP